MFLSPVLHEASSESVTVSESNCILGESAHQTHSGDSEYERLVALSESTLPRLLPATWLIGVLREPLFVLGTSNYCLSPVHSMFLDLKG
mgnify:CR=1 FL=1